MTACGGEQEAGLKPAPPSFSAPPIVSAEPGSVAPPPSQSPPVPNSSSAPERAARGTVPPPWLGTRRLPKTEDGFGEVRPTPRLMRVRRWNTADSIPALPGNGFKAVVADPAPWRV